MSPLIYSLNPLNPKLVLIIFKNPFLIQKTRTITITKLSLLMLFNEIIAVYSENYIRTINAIYRQTQHY